MLQPLPEWPIQSRGTRDCRPHPCLSTPAEVCYFEVETARGEIPVGGASCHEVKGLE